MHLQPLFLWLSLAVGTCLAADPVPQSTFLYSVNLTFPGNGNLNIGRTSAGNRVAMPILGGTFAGPKLSGVALYGLDWGLTDNFGIFREDTIYYLQTADGALIMVRANGIGQNVHHSFETSSSKYSWLNGVIGYAAGRQVRGQVGLDVWQMGAAAGQRPAPGNFTAPTGGRFPPRATAAVEEQT
ncbi:hypothetical protein B0H66DRAFT_530856 [Apodospora peruviana]|uniref:Uncharacterized protein n=1 Tax=Apodospora peruviana TaxID=516989 RepID=A0AAE0MC01_9PEZI|nr:hypothetical protein B0H66DRAFT_530856 [Apodospora peruviana]